MRLFIFSLVIAVSSLAHGNSGSVTFSGIVLQAPCSVEVVQAKPIKVHESITKECAQTQSITTEAVYRSPSVSDTKELAGYVVSVKYQ